MARSKKESEAEIVEKKAPEKIYAKFWQRLCAFIIDMFLISMVASVITQPFTNQENIQKLSDEANTTMKEYYKKKKIDVDTYINRTSDISYDMARETVLLSIINIAIALVYFVIVQFKNNGQTIGKKLLHIRVVKQDNSNLTMNDILFRALLIDSILFDMIILCFTVFSNKDGYFYGVGSIIIIQYLVLFVSCMMILSKNNKQGLHDIIAKTEVIKTE